MFLHIPCVWIDTGTGTDTGNIVVYGNLLCHVVAVC